MRPSLATGEMPSRAALSGGASGPAKNGSANLLASHIARSTRRRAREGADDEAGRDFFGGPLTVGGSGVILAVGGPPAGATLACDASQGRGAVQTLGPEPQGSACSGLPWPAPIGTPNDQAPQRG